MCVYVRGCAVLCCYNYDSGSNWIKLVDTHEIAHKLKLKWNRMKSYRALPFEFAWMDNRVFLVRSITMQNVSNSTSSLGEFLPQIHSISANFCTCSLWFRYNFPKLLDLMRSSNFQDHADIELFPLKSPKVTKIKKIISPEPTTRIWK